MENIKNDVNDIKNQIKSLNNDLVEIQSNCTHEKTVLKYNEESKNVLKLCDNCEKVIGYPTQEELKNSDFL